MQAAKIPAVLMRRDSTLFFYLRSSSIEAGAKITTLSTHAIFSIAKSDRVCRK